MASSGKQKKVPRFTDSPVVPVALDGGDTGATTPEEATADLPAATNALVYTFSESLDPIFLEGADGTRVEITPEEHAHMTKWLGPKAIKSVVREANGALTVTSWPGGLQRTLGPA